MGDKGVDCYGHLDGAALRAAGFMFACRYFTRVDDKRLGFAERDSLLAAGAVIVPVYEDDRNDAVTGRRGGLDNGIRGATQLRLAGGPAGTGMYYACDRNDVTVDDVRPYYQAAAEPTRDAGYRPGAYGSMRICRALLAEGVVDLGWIVDTWIDGGPTDVFHLAQRPNTPNVNIGGTNCDVDEALQADYGGWADQPNPPPAPVSVTYPGDNVELITMQVGGVVGGQHVSTDDQGHGSTLVPGVPVDRFVNAFANTAGYTPLPLCVGRQDQGGDTLIEWVGEPRCPPFEAIIVLRDTP